MRRAHLRVACVQPIWVAFAITHISLQPMQALWATTLPLQLSYTSAHMSRILTLVPRCLPQPCSQRKFRGRRLGAGRP